MIRLVQLLDESPRPVVGRFVSSSCWTSRVVQLSDDLSRPVAFVAGRDEHVADVEQVAMISCFHFISIAMNY